MQVGYLIPSENQNHLVIQEGFLMGYTSTHNLFSPKLAVGINPIDKSLHPRFEASFWRSHCHFLKVPPESRHSPCCTSHLWKACLAFSMLNNFPCSPE